MQNLVFVDDKEACGAGALQKFLEVAGLAIVEVREGEITEIALGTAERKHIPPALDAPGREKLLHVAEVVEPFGRIK